MGSRADLLSLVVDAPGRLRTLRAALTTWLDRAVVAAVHAPPSDDDGRPLLSVVPEVAARPRAVHDDGPGVLTSWYVVVALPDRWRIVGRGHLVVTDGDRSWAGTSTLVTERDASRAAIQDGGVIASCLYPRSLLDGLEIGSPERDEVEGRPCWAVDARSVAEADRGPGVDGGGAAPALLHPDLAGVDHRLWFDAGTGIMLRHEGYVDGTLCSTAALTDLVVDAPVDAAQFAPPPGAVVRSRHELLRDHLSEMGIDPDTVDLDDPAQVRDALRQSR